MDVACIHRTGAKAVPPGVAAAEIGFFFKKVRWDDSG